MRKSLTALSAAILAATGAGWATDAHAAAWPGWTDGQQMEIRLLVGGVNRQFQPQIIATANAACGILRADPTPAGKKSALAYLHDEAGYYLGYQQGFALGTMVDVTCPDMLRVIR